MCARIFFGLADAADVEFGVKLNVLNFLVYIWIAISYNLLKLLFLFIEILTELHLGKRPKETLHQSSRIRFHNGYITMNLILGRFFFACVSLL